MFLTERTLDRIVDRLDFELDLKSVISLEEYNVLQEQGLVDETRDFVYVPNGLVTSPCVYKISKVYTEEYDILQFIDHVIETITLPFEVSLNVGFFTRDRMSNKLEYIKPSATQSVVTASLTNLEHYWRFRRDIRDANVDLLKTAFDSACERRQINGWNKPISAIIFCIYIRKL